MTKMRDAAMNSKAWPFEEARRLLKRYEKARPEKGHVLFETGYGPSGLPHIGTFGEVLRTTMVRRAFEQISDIPTKLVCFSDDLDGMRKVPSNVPNPEILEQHLQRPLTSVPDPFG
ncbi:MAG: lysine--tRNA ligase, partial [Pseudomonadota bacterium]